MVGRNHVSRLVSTFKKEEIEAIYDKIKNTYVENGTIDEIIEFEESIRENRQIPQFKRGVTLKEVFYSRTSLKNIIRGLYELRNFDKLKKFDNTKVNQKLKDLLTKYIEERKKEEKQSQISNDTKIETIPVTPKQIACLDQMEGITTDEIADVEKEFNNLIKEKQDKGNQQTYE